MRQQVSPAMIALILGLVPASLALAETIGNKTAGTPDPAPEEIRIYRHSFLIGTHDERLTSDDRLILTTRRPGQHAMTGNRHLRPGAYDAALRYLRAHPIPEQQLKSDETCMDYGSDEISGDGISYRVECPSDAVSALAEGLRQIISDHQ